MAGCIHCGRQENTTLLKVQKDYEMFGQTETVCLECVERYRCTECGEIDGTTQQYLFGYRLCSKCRPEFPKPKIKEELGIPLALKKLFAETLIAWLKEGMLREEVLHLDTGYIRLPAVKTFRKAAETLEYWWGYSLELPKNYREQVQRLIKRLSAIIIDEIVMLCPNVIHVGYPKLVSWLCEGSKDKKYPPEIVVNVRNINKGWNPEDISGRIVGVGCENGRTA